MKNVVVSSVAYMIVLLFMLGCSGQSKQSKEKDVVTESVEVLNVKENMLSTLELDGCDYRKCGSIKCQRKYAIHLRT